MKHTIHSRQRVSERTDAKPFWISEKIRKREYIGLPKQTNNKRVALVEYGKQKEPLVVVWTKSTQQIITVLKLDQYIQSSGNQLPSDLWKIIYERYGRQSLDGRKVA